MAERVRVMSSKIFNNEKLIEVVLALAAGAHAATAKQIATRTGIDHSLVRDVLVRLADAGFLAELPRAYSRAPRYYEADPEDAAWAALLALARAVAAGCSDAGQLDLQWPQDDGMQVEVAYQHRRNAAGPAASAPDRRSLE